MKFACASWATAFARSVFPVPGGPKSRKPLAGRMPSRLKESGYLSGSSIPSRRISFASSWPPMSSQITFGNLHHDLPECRRLDALHGFMKSSRVTHEILEHFCGISFAAEIDSRKIASERLEGRFAGERGEIGSHIPVGELWRSRRSSRLPAGACPGCECSRISLPPCTSGTPTVISRSNRPGRRSASSSASTRLVAPITITFCRGFRPSMSVRSCATTRRSTSPVTSSRFGRDGVDLVDEDDRRSVLLRIGEHVAQPLFRLAVELAHDLGAGDVVELRLGFVRDRPCEERLSGSRRTVEEHALGRIDSEAVEELGMAERQLDHLPHLLDRVPEASDIVVGHIGRPRLLGFHVLRQQVDLGLFVHPDDALREVEVTSSRISCSPNARCSKKERNTSSGNRFWFISG